MAERTIVIQTDHYMIVDLGVPVENKFGHLRQFLLKYRRDSRCDWKIIRKLTNAEVLGDFLEEISNCIDSLKREGTAH